MGDVHDLDHIKLDLNDQPSSSSPPKPAQTPANWSTQTAKINHKLEYYLTLIASSKGVALLKLIQDLLASNGVYVFGEILESKPIQELANHPTDAQYHELLEIFAYGTWGDYRERRDHLPELNEHQISKLKLLSILARASHSKIIPYSDLLEELEIDQTQALEELIIDGIYSGLLGGRLDQKYSRLEVESSVGRDVRLRPLKRRQARLASKSADEDVEMENNDGRVVVTPSNTLVDLHAQLASWRDSIANVLTQLDQQIDSIRQKDQAKLDQQARHTATIESLSQTIYYSLFSSSSSSSSSQHNNYQKNNTGGSSNRKGKDKDTVDSSLSSDHQMDIDELDNHMGSSKTRKRTRP